MIYDGVGVEAEFLLFILRQSPGEFDLSISRNEFSPLAEVDFEKIVDLAIKNGLAGLLYVRVENSACFPGELVEKLKTQYRQSAYRNLFQLTELLRIIDVFNSCGVEIIPLKGVVDSEKLFGDVGLYPSSDIDLLVPEHKLPTLCSMLNQHGYNPIKGIAEADLFSSHYHLIYRKNGACIELHWNLVKTYFDIPAEFWWEGGTARTYMERDIIELSAEKYLLYLIFRLFDHQFTPLKFWVHISAFITHSLPLNWDRLLRYSESFGMKKLVVFTLKLVQELFGTEIPSEICNTKLSGYSFLRNLVLEQNFGDNCRPHVTALYCSCGILPPKMIVKILLSRIYTTKAEIRLRYGLKAGSKSVILYMILNPILMLLRKKR
jgi:hypothetical protein